MRIQSRIQANINLDAIDENLKNMHDYMGEDTQIIAVLKADGYGHGAVPIAKEIQDYSYIWGIAVATVEEGKELRKAGIKKPILILGYTYEEDYEQIVEEDFQPTVFKLSMAEQLSKAAVKAGKILKIHIKLDTGMTRIGYRHIQDAVPEILKISKLSGIAIEGIFTHFARADECSLTPAYQQLKKYQEFLKALEKEGISVPIKHCSNSAAIMRMQDAYFDAVRAGIILYGMYPSDDVERDKIHFNPVMELKSHIAYIKEVESGVEISYGGTFTTEKTTRVATIPVGYADGYSRGLSNKGSVLIRGKRAKILGKVCMDQFMVDVTEIPEAEELDEVTLLGKDGTDCITMEELGTLSGRFNYEFACCISKRVPRVYYKNGQVRE